MKIPPGQVGQLELEKNTHFQGVHKTSNGYKLLSTMGWKEGEGLVLFCLLLLLPHFQFVLLLLHFVVQYMYAFFQRFFLLSFCFILLFCFYWFYDKHGSEMMNCSCCSHSSSLSPCPGAGPGSDSGPWPFLNIATQNLVESRNALLLFYLFLATSSAVLSGSLNQKSSLSLLLCLLVCLLHSPTCFLSFNLAPHGHTLMEFPSSSYFILFFFYFYILSYMYLSMKLFTIHL